MKQNQNTINLPHFFNDFGEAELPQAPLATLENNFQAVPQQFLHYERTVENVEAIIRLIDFHKNFPIFVFEESGHVFLQVGIIGHENYPPQKSAHAERNDKIVYGRRWYIEPYTPTSEVIQTTFLAINKVREHEIRELLTLSLLHRDKKRQATPFNSHLDLPLAAKNPELFDRDKDCCNNTDYFVDYLRKLEQTLTLGTCKLSVDDINIIDDNHCFVSCHFSHVDASAQLGRFMDHFFPELINEKIIVICSTDYSVFLHELISTLLHKCEDFVRERFTFDGFARFSKNINPHDLSKFSLDTRLVNEQRTPDFNKLFSAMVQLVDGSKAPAMAMTPSLFAKQQQSLNHHEEMEGFLPTKLEKELSQQYYDKNNG